MNSTWTRPQIFVSYETPEMEDSWQRDYESVVPGIGEGVIDSKGRRWRVSDVWHSDDKHGAVDYGIHVYLEPVERLSEDDLPGRLHPDYFTA